MILVVDYGMGNVGSILNMLKKIGAQVITSAEPEVIRRADKLILPGVGAFDSGMKRLEELGLIDVLHHQVLDRGVPVLGVCLGMQLLTRRSEEGVRPGLGWIPGETIRFRMGDDHAGLKIPHMGWNTISVRRVGAIFAGLERGSRFYFVHSYHVVCDDPEDILTTTFYGYDFVSSAQRRNVLGTQFHPEKSHKFGMKLLRNFVEMAVPC